MTGMTGTTLEVLEMMEDGISNCCSAGVINDMCMGCKEHCEVITEEE